VRLINDCIAERRPGTAIGIHICRGNARSAWIAEGGYERIAEATFGRLDADHFLLEYDDERSGDFAPLRFVPRGKRVVLGLVTTKHGRLESRDVLLQRIEWAARHIPLADLAIGPQCGFASVVEGNVITEADQWRSCAWSSIRRTKSGTPVSNILSEFPIGLGCMAMSGLYGPADDAESIATIHMAIDRGVTLLDTGDFYGMGHNEMLLGKALAGGSATASSSR